MAEPPLTIGVVAGEASGDLLGSHLIKAVRARLPQARFAGIGGPRMQSAGLDVLYPMEKLAVRGYVEVLRHYREIVGIRRSLAAHFLAAPPALFIGVDAPDFNLDLELKLKSAGIPTAHFVSPSIWAWRAGRINKIRRAVSKMLVIFPFEREIYERAGVPVTYVGHPLAETLIPTRDRSAMREQLRMPAAAKVITLLPGSRMSELEQLAGLFIDTAKQIAAVVPDVHFLVPLVNRPTRERFETALYHHQGSELNMTLLFGHSHEAMAAADVVLAASGTATLEAALVGRPVVITYRMAPLTWRIMSLYRHMPYAGLPNIIAGEFVAPEFLQEEATADNLTQAILNLLFDGTVRARMEDRFAAMAAELKQDSAARLAEGILPLVRERSGMILVCGVDEAGRGPLAGPVFAAAVILDASRPITGIADSKKLAASRRESLAVEIQLNSLAWAVASASVEEIDAINILQASLLAMRRAVEKLKVAPQQVLVDGLYCPRVNFPSRAIVKGDSKVMEIAAASILAKVARDEAMLVLHRELPQYGFDRHKGYPTPAHLDALRTHGASNVHRRTFGPVRIALGGEGGTS